MKYILIIGMIFFISCSQESTTATQSDSYDPTLNEQLNGLNLSDDVDSILIIESMVYNIACRTSLNLMASDSIISLIASNGKCIFRTDPVDSLVYTAIVFTYKINNIESYYNNGIITQVGVIAINAELTPYEYRMQSIYEYGYQKPLYYISLLINNNSNEVIEINIQNYGDKYRYPITALSDESVEGFNLYGTVIFR